MIQRRQLTLVHCPRESWVRLPVIEFRRPLVETELVDRCGRRRSPATLPGFRKGRKPANAGHRYPPAPMTDEDVLTLIIGQSRTSATGLRNRALIATLYRSGLRISEALDLQVPDLMADKHMLFVRHGKGDKARLVAMDAFGWEHLDVWLERRGKLGVGDGFVFCTIAKPVTGGRLGSPYVRMMLRRTADAAGLQRRVNPHAFRHGMAFGMAREGIPVPVISKALGHSNVGTTSTYLSHVDPSMLVDTVVARPRPGASDEWA